MARKEAFIERMLARLDAARLEINTLIAREDQVAAAAYAEYSHHVNEMQQRCEALRAVIKKFQSCRDEEAETLQSGLETAWEILAQTLESARARFC